MDPSEDQIQLFQQKAKAMDVETQPQRSTWLEIPQHYQRESYDLLLCRGNSFIYAAGGWNEHQEVNKEKSFKLYEETLRIFHESLRTGGFLYVDKFKDNEENGETTFAQVLIDDKPIELTFSHNINRELNTRQVYFFTKRSNGTKDGASNITYNLSEQELIELFGQVGFRNIKKLKLETEKHFDAYLAQK